jgi:hypothetical protein
MIGEGLMGELKCVMGSKSSCLCLSEGSTGVWSVEGRCAVSRL